MKKTIILRIILLSFLLTNLVACMGIPFGSNAMDGVGKSAGDISFAPYPGGNAEGVVDDGIFDEPGGGNPDLDGPEININGWVKASEDNLSTFAADVDTASYTYMRARLELEIEPDPKAIRPEEFINYFDYNYPDPAEDDVFDVNLDIAPSLNNPDNRLLRVGIQGKRLDEDNRKKANLVFLVDVSGSMQDENKLPLAKESLKLLVNSLKADDSIALVTYAGNTSIVLERTLVENRGVILAAIDNLDAGGSTAMGAGLELAYAEAVKGVETGATSRVIVVSDGDANVGMISHEKILERIRSKVQEGIYLTTVGFGMGNYRDNMMEQLANKGNGQALYIDRLSEAKRVFRDELLSTLEVIAKDLKIQVKFDEDVVSEYRLIGFENRDIADDDFRDDMVDAGEVGPGHSVTALYELKFVGEIVDDAAQVRLRWKDPDNGDEVTEELFQFAVAQSHASIAEAPRNMRLAASVGGFAEILRDSPHVEALDLIQVQAEIELILNLESDAERELLSLVKAAKLLQ